MVNDDYGHPSDPDKHPPTKIAADGRSTLKRFRVIAVVYAPRHEDAQRRIEQASIYLDAAEITT